MLSAVCHNLGDVLCVLDKTCHLLIGSLLDDDEPHLVCHLCVIFLRKDLSSRCNASTAS